jgi:hypothetical protein
MSENLLHSVQTLQFSDKSKAETILKSFLHDTFDLEIVAVELRPLAVSLNSFNGFLTVKDGSRLFFKTHIEPDNVINEYYNASRLAAAGYPVIQPVFSSTEAGKQILIYEVIDDPSVFDVAWEIENGDESKLLDLTKAQHEADDLLRQLFIQTFAFQTADEAAQAPIHQLFHHRLMEGRLTRFYGALPNHHSDNKYHIDLPQGQFNMRDVRQAQWQINGQGYDQSLDDLIINAIRLLNPSQAGMSVIGHGDAHNGNVFLQLQNAISSLLYFDPAFAGRHDPLLDLTKPLFHNVFAMWMYFVREKTEQTNITLNIEDNLWRVEHNYALHAVRKMFLESKVKRVLVPTLELLKEKGYLRPDWRSYLKAALFCCPFLTMNLADAKKFTPEISLLGLAMSVEMGAESSGKRSLIDQTLDGVAQALT